MIGRLSSLLSLRAALRRSNPGDPRERASGDSRDRHVARLRFLAMTRAACLSTGAAHAQIFPTKPVRFVVGEGLGARVD